jgi:polyhydroxyalkanoate synthesis repressor PhaR
MQQRDVRVKPKPVVIKKYGNRRLYDTVGRRYINLEEVAALVRKGADVQVVDAKTRADLTRSVLTQIIMEEAKDQPAGLPLELLRQLIIATDYAQQQFLSWYLRSAFETYHKLWDAVQNGLTDVSSAAMAPFQRVREFIAGALSPEAAQETGLEIEQLRRRVAELETQLNRTETRAPRKRATKRRAPAPR